MAAWGEKHLEIVFTVLPPFKLQMENKPRVKRDEEHVLDINTVTYQAVSRCNWVVDDEELYEKQT